MFKRLTTIKIGVLEFLYKFLLVLFVIMPICMGGCFWIGVQADAALNIHLLKFIMPFVGSLIGLFFTALLLQAGHKNVPATVEEPVKSFSDTLVSSRSEITETASQPKPSIPRAGFVTPYSVQGGK
ncbi:MAG: hypothetical protein WC541_00255 [Dehalococcoidia bacterium]